MLLKNFFLELIKDLDVGYEDLYYLRGCIDCLVPDDVTTSTNFIIDKIATVMRYSDDSGD